jgi:XTP/dITP diphosphohydrolase
MKKILIGTGNPAKINAYKQFLKDLNLELVTSKDLNIEEPAEDADSFEKQAIEKAKYYFEKTGLPTIADDGGFEIEALNGEPGIKSRRWIGREMSDEEIIDEVMKRMTGVENRVCRHTVTLAIATPFGVFTSHGDIVGVVADKPSENRIERFPYRSVMFLPNYNKYWAELNQEEEEILDHRKHAIGKLQDILKELST